MAEEIGQKVEQGKLRTLDESVMECALWRCWPLERKLSEEGCEMRPQLRPKWLITMMGVLLRKPKGGCS